MILNLEDSVLVDVNDRDYMVELKDQGPLKRVYLPVKTVIELLNNNRLVNFHIEEQKQALFLLIKSYNLQVDNLKNKKFRKAEIAEMRLSKNLYDKYTEESLKEAENNPLELPITSEEIRQEQMIIDETNLKLAKEENKRDKKIHNIRKTDIFKTSKVGMSENKTKFDEIELDL